MLQLNEKQVGPTPGFAADLDPRKHLPLNIAFHHPEISPTAPEWSFIYGRILDDAVYGSFYAPRVVHPESLHPTRLWTPERARQFVQAVIALDYKPKASDLSFSTRRSAYMSGNNPLCSGNVPRRIAELLHVLPLHALAWDYSDILAMENTSRLDAWAGLRIGSLTVQQVRPHSTGQGKEYSCVCDCGHSVVITTADLGANRVGCGECHAYREINLGASRPALEEYTARKTGDITSQCKREAESRRGGLATQAETSARGIKKAVAAETVRLITTRWTFTDAVQLGAFAGQRLRPSVELHRHLHELGGPEIPYCPLGCYWLPGATNAGVHKSNIFVGEHGRAITLAEAIRAHVPGAALDKMIFKRAQTNISKNLKRAEEAAGKDTQGSWTDAGKEAKFKELVAAFTASEVSKKSPKASSKRAETKAKK
jgi:hypothetical protein